MTPKLTRRSFEVVDVELAHVFYCDTPGAAEDFRIIIEKMGHHAILKEIQS